MCVLECNKNYILKYFFIWKYIKIIYIFLKKLIFTIIQLNNWKHKKTFNLEKKTEIQKFSK
jgi:hypothetical protein